MSELKKIVILSDVNKIAKRILLQKISLTLKTDPSLFLFVHSHTKSPTKMKIEYLSFIKNYLLTVYFIPSKGWRYSMVLSDGTIYQPSELYETSLQADRVARNVIQLVYQSGSI